MEGLASNFHRVQKLGGEGGEVKVMNPESLVAAVKKFHERALAEYEQ